MRIKLSTLSSSFMSCQRFQDFSPPTPTSPTPYAKTNKSKQHPRQKPSLYHRAEQLLESLPATCGNCRNCHFEKHNTVTLTNWSQTVISKFLSRKSVPLAKVHFRKCYISEKNLGCSSFEIRQCVEKLWVVAMFSTSMTLGTLQPCQELLGDTSTSDASQPQRT